MLWIKKTDRSSLPMLNGARHGLRIRSDRGVDADVKAAFHRLAIWLRSEYAFPVRVPVYLKKSERIRAMDGDMTVGLFFEPFDKEREPYIRIATGDYYDLLVTDGRDDATATLLAAMIHELSHYYQWLLGLELSDAAAERQARYYEKAILSRYAETREHP